MSTQNTQIEATDAQKVALLTAESRNLFRLLHKSTRNLLTALAGHPARHVAVAALSLPLRDVRAFYAEERAAVADFAAKLEAALYIAVPLVDPEDCPERVAEVILGCLEPSYRLVGRAKL